VPWNKLYRVPFMPLPKMPADFEALHTYINRRQNRYKYRDRGLDMNLIRLIRAHYYACISFIDFQVGRVLEALERSGQLDNTLILFMSDHGEHLGDYGCFGKRSMHDTCARVPLLARLPGRFDAGAVCDEPVSLVDIAPALLAATGTDGAMESDGVDLADVAAGTCDRDIVYSQYQREGQAIYTAVTREWKYAYSAPDNREFLFDRLADPDETCSHADAPSCKDALGDMRQRMMECLRSGGETAALDGDDWKIYPHLDVDPNPDAGLLVQDAPGADYSIPGYTD